MSDEYIDYLVYERRMERAFGKEFTASRKLLPPIANKDFEGTPDEGEIVK
jgi:hypothetical protein